MTSVNWPFSRRGALKISRADGLYLYGEGGEPILDAAGGAIVCNVGHGRKRVAEAMAKAAEETSFILPPWLTPSRAALVEQLEKSWLPEGLSRMHFCSGGSEAVETAIKLALTYHSAQGNPGRRKIISRDVSYHGTTLTTAALSGHAARKQGMRQALPDNPVAPTPYPLRHPLGRNAGQDAAYYIERTRELIEREGPDTVAAFIGEPITGSSGGAIVPPDDYWPAIRELCDTHGIVLICDEVMTGFGRTGTRFGFEHWDFVPDILVTAKGLTGGYAPLGGIFAREEMGEALDESGLDLMFHTFGGHPVACAAAAEVLSILVEEELVERSRKMGALLRACLEDALGSHSNVAEIRGRGLLLAVEVVKDKDTLERFPISDRITDRIVIAGVDRGVFLYPGGTGLVRDILCLGPAFTLSESDIEKIVTTLKDSLDSVIKKR